MKVRKNEIFKEVPKNPDCSKQYLFYLHGLIVELAGIRPKSEEHGYYEYELILEELAGAGFVVISEAREKDTQVKPYAGKVASQIKTLLFHGVPPEQITIVGASKGGAITAYISNLLQERRINYVFLAGLFEKYLVYNELKLYGNVLSIHDQSDTFGITPQLYFERSAGLGKFEAVILDHNKGHGIIYKPYREWFDVMLKWLQQE